MKRGQKGTPTFEWNINSCVGLLMKTWGQFHKHFTVVTYGRSSTNKLKILQS